MTRYLVTGPTAVFGHQPGELFDAELTEAQEARQIARGSLAIASTKSTARPARPAGATTPRKRKRRGRAASKPIDHNGGGK